MQQRNNMDFSLSLNDTLLIKGVAICAMLWHHLFGGGIQDGVVVCGDKIIFLLRVLGIIDN